MITASTNIDRDIIQLSPLVKAEKSSDTNWRTRRIAGDDDDYHVCRIRPYQREKSNKIDIFEIEYHSYKSIECDHQSDNLQSMA